MAPPTFATKPEETLSRRGGSSHRERRGALGRTLLTPRARPPRAYRMLIVGLGRAGTRFARAVEHLERTSHTVELVGVCDRDPSTRDRLERAVPVFDRVDVALRECEPEIVCVCVNEVSHFDVLTSIAECRQHVRLVLCEKPLTETLEQCAIIERLFAPHDIAVNFVERYSPIVDHFSKLRASLGLSPCRIEFFWGKCRYRDGRPTIGILSEISHPVDLCRALVGGPVSAKFELLSASAIRSDFAFPADHKLDSIDVRFKLGGVVVAGHSSFVWDRRTRRIVVYARSPHHDSLYQAVLNFDDPHWDHDRLDVYALDSRSGSRDRVYDASCSSIDFPAELERVFKVARFIHEGVETLADGGATGHTVDLRGAKWVQEALNDMAEACESRTSEMEFEAEARAAATGRAAG
jgi:Oxidoreductase family, NAD-binding Rossmann fold